MRARLAIASLLLTALASGALAQSLAEAAAKERERRERERKKAGTAAKVVTDEQLGKTGGSLALDGSTAEAAVTPRRRSGDEEPGDPEEWADLSRSEREELRRQRDAGKPGVAAAGDRREEQETSWRERATRTRGRIKTAQEALERLKAEKEKVLGDALRSTDTNEIIRLRSRATELDDEVRQAEGELKDALDEQRELEDEARQAGVPPGWIREG